MTYSDTPVPDVAGKDLADSPVERARALAQQLEAENTERLKRIASLGVDPNGFALPAMQMRLEALIDSLPDGHRALVEVSFETGMAHMLDDALEDIGKPKLLRPGD